MLLSTLQSSLNASGAELVWIINAYLLTLASLILIGGALGDQYGRNRIFGAGIMLFTAASLACGLARAAHAADYAAAGVTWWLEQVWPSAELSEVQSIIHRGLPRHNG